LITREVHTVTAFLRSKDQILILLRSDRVRNFKNIWGAVSGLIENGLPADEQVRLEIKEETGLSGSDIQLVKTGETQIIDDLDRNLRKIVYPYLFDVKEPARIRINWEHSDYKWINPGDIDRYPTMPELKQTLQKVLTLD
jgi:8-oxo-dGTP diphosphatase